MRYFEAVARHGSFTEAAEELCISQAAVSHQVKLLEQELDAKVLKRTTRRVELTEQGRDLFDSVTQALNILTDTTTRIRSAGSSDRLNLTVTPFFSGHWLVPRLPKFSSRFPDVQVKLHHSQEQPTRQALSDGEGNQIFVMYGDGDWDGFQSDYLFSADLLPMCSPSLIGGRRSLDDARDLLNYPLIHEFDYAWWTNWLQLAGIKRPTVQFGPIVDDPNVLIRAALGLQGIVLGPPLFYEDHIAGGSLVIPLGEQTSIPIDYYLIIPNEMMMNPQVRNLRDWMLGESARYHEEFPRSLPDRYRNAEPQASAAVG
jgi:DNA-binding transcriptional LysR family regulator